MGLGVDIVEIGRMRSALERHPRIKKRCFSVAERDYCELRNRPDIHYALRFAAKEAVLKALGTGFTGMRFTDVEVDRDSYGRPIPILHGKAREAAEALGVQDVHLSLSYTHETAVASAVAIGADPIPCEEPELTARERLAADFKGARSLLDGIEREHGAQDGSGE